MVLLLDFPEPAELPEDLIREIKLEECKKYPCKVQARYVRDRCSGQGYSVNDEHRRGFKKER